MRESKWDDESSDRRDDGDGGHQIVFDESRHEPAQRSDTDDGIAAYGPGERRMPSQPGRVQPSPAASGPALADADRAVVATAGVSASTAASSRSLSPIASRVADIRRRLPAWWSGSADNLRGTIFMIGSFLVFSIMTASIKAIGPAIPLVEVLIIRQLVMTALLMPLFLSDLKGALRTDRFGVQMARGLFSLGSMLCGFTAIQYIPLADATALGFSQVLFTTIAAVIVLKETVGWTRWAATLVGFVGVIIMLKPTGGGLNQFALLALIGAVFGSGVTVTVRMLARTEGTATILLYQAMVLIVVLTVPTIVWWVWPSPREWALMALIGIVGTGGQYLITKAYQAGEAAALAPLDFIRLLIATAIGFVIFAEVPGWTTVVGASIVIASTIYTVRRNARRVTPPVVPGEEPFTP